MKKSLLLFILFFYAFVPKAKDDAGVVQAEIGFANGNGVYKSGESLRILYKIKNVSAYTVKANIGGSISSLEGKIFKKLSKYIEIPPKQSKNVYFSYQPSLAGLYNVYLQLSNKSGRLAANSLKMGYALEKISSPLTRKTDFNQFWQGTKTSLAKISPQFKIIPKPKLNTAYYKVYLIEMKSLGYHTVKAWYRVPVRGKNHPIVLQLPSLGGSFYNVQSLGKRPKHGVPLDFAVLSLNIRGHGNSKGNIKVSADFKDYITIGLAKKSTYIYRGAIADCIRSIDFIYTRPELNKSKLVVEGASQGGALSLMVAGLDRRVNLCCPDVPFLSDIDNLLQSAKWVKKAVTNYMKANNITLWRAKYNLSYFDTKNFADKITAPVYMSVGLQDWTCPAMTSLASYNKIKSSKSCEIYPKGKHGGGGAVHRKKKFNWIRKQFGM